MSAPRTPSQAQWALPRRRRPSIIDEAKCDEQRNKERTHGHDTSALQEKGLFPDQRARFLELQSLCALRVVSLARRISIAGMSVLCPDTAVHRDAS